MLLAAANAGEAFPMVPAPHPFRPYSQKVPRSTIAPGHPEIIYTGTLLHEDVAILDANEITLHEFLSDLHGVKGSALAHVIGDNPHIEAVLDGVILADAAHECIVLAHTHGSVRVHEGTGVVINLYAGSLGEKQPAVLGRKLLLGLNVHRFGVAVEDRHAGAGVGEYDSCFLCSGCINIASSKG